MIEPVHPATQGSSQSRPPIVVLLVDDQRFVGAAVGQLLSTEPDIELHCCYQAAEAVARASEIVPTIVLQDLVMPDIDGLTLLRLYRANPVTAGTPIIVLSGNDDAATRARALAEGASDYVVKLPAKADLIACIRRHSPLTADGVVAAPLPPATSMPQSMVANETLDRNTIATYLEMGSLDFVRNVIDLYLREAGSQVLALKHAVEHQDGAELTATAHSLKGSSAIMGASQLGALCAQVEGQLAGTTGVLITSALMHEIDLELVRVRDALATVRLGKQS